MTRKEFIGICAAGLSSASWTVKEITSTFLPKLPSVKITSIDLLEAHGEWLLVVSGNESLGITQCNARMKHLVSLLKGLVLPHFLGKDARDVETLVDNAYRLNSNYKYAGMPLWNCIGTVELAVWDLLGKVAKKPVYSFFGPQNHTDYPVYISDFSREGDIEKIVSALEAKIVTTRAAGVKIKIGGRLKNLPENTAFTKKLVPAVRKMLGNERTIYADANGSYTLEEAKYFGALLEDYGVEIWEEPVNFEDEASTKLVTSHFSKLKIAGGEQDTSLYKFERLAKDNILDILQPDLYYNGGLLRTLEVSRIAKKYDKITAPHSPKADPLIGPFWQYAAIVPEIFGLQETVFNPNEKVENWYWPNVKISDGRIKISDEPGLGFHYDEKSILNGKPI